MERYVKAKVVLQEDQKPVTRCFFVVAETFGHAEQVIAEETGSTEYTAMEFVSFNGGLKESEGESLFRVTSDLVTLNEVTGREQRTRLCTLVWGDDVEGVTELMRREKDDSEELVKVEKLNVADIIGGRP